MWEYKIIKDWEGCGNPDSEYELNELGKEGWELVAIKQQPAKGHIWYFKRPDHLCKKCGGKGWVEIPDDHSSTCLTCSGTGIRGTDKDPEQVTE